MSLGPDEGLPQECVAACDSFLTIPKNRCDEDPVGELDAARVPELDAALRFALRIWF